MIGDFLLRLAVALPLVCLAAAATIWAMRRGWLPAPRARRAVAGRAPGWPIPLVARLRADRPSGTPALLEIVEARALGPVARLAVVRFGGEDLLLGASGDRLELLARQPAMGQGVMASGAAGQSPAGDSLSSQPDSPAEAAAGTQPRPDAADATTSAMTNAMAKTPRARRPRATATPRADLGGTFPAPGSTGRKPARGSAGNPPASAGRRSSGAGDSAAARSSSVNDAHAALEDDGPPRQVPGSDSRSARAPAERALPPGSRLAGPTIERRA